MKVLVFTAAILVLVNFSGCSQPAGSAGKQAFKTDVRVGGSCEGCKAIYESVVPFEKSDWIDTLPDYFDSGPKMEISGIVYKRDGKTPAPNVVLYIYHTDQAGKYATRGNEKGWGRRHGYIRGWMKTNEKGAYKFYTIKPASYPQSKIPAHIHPIIKEPGINEYWIDEYLFENDVFLTAQERENQKQHGGNGIILLTSKDGLLVGKRDIILGLNVPGYPDDRSAKLIFATNSRR